MFLPLQVVRKNKQPITSSRVPFIYVGNLFFVWISSSFCSEEVEGCVSLDTVSSTNLCRGSGNRLCDRAMTLDPSTWYDRSHLYCITIINYLRSQASSARIEYLVFKLKELMNDTIGFINLVAQLCADSIYITVDELRFRHRLQAKWILLLIVWLIKMDVRSDKNG